MFVVAGKIDYVPPAMRQGQTEIPIPEDSYDESKGLPLLTYFYIIKKITANGKQWDTYLTLWPDSKDIRNTILPFIFSLSSFFSHHQPVLGGIDHYLREVSLPLSLTSDEIISVFEDEGRRGSVAASVDAPPLALTRGDTIVCVASLVAERGVHPHPLDFGVAEPGGSFMVTGNTEHGGKIYLCDISSQHQTTTERLVIYVTKINLLWVLF